MITPKTESEILAHSACVKHSVFSDLPDFTCGPDWWLQESGAITRERRKFKMACRRLGTFAQQISYGMLPA